MNRIKILDSLRGIAAVVVVFHHIYKFYSVQLNNPILQFISDLNYEAVLFFFIVSGFSISLSLKNESHFNKEIINNYLYRRFKRIIPLYLFTLFFTLIIGFFINQIMQPEYSILNLLGNLFFMQSSEISIHWFTPYGKNGPLWSLSYEMFYYLVFPLYYMILSKVIKFKSREMFLVFCLIISFIYSIVCIALRKFIFFPQLTYSTLFFIWFGGYYLAELLKMKSDKLKYSILLYLILFLIIQLIVFNFHSDTLISLSRGISISILFILGLVINNSTQHFYLTKKIKFITNFLFYKIGTGSYTLYLLHYPVILLLFYLHCNALSVITIISIFGFICIKIESYFVNRQFVFFKRAYLK